MSEFASEK